MLIVDDSPTARLVLRRSLERDPNIYVVGEATTGGAALKMIQRFEPDLVTMDVHLGEENGIDVVETIMSTCPRPILVVTGVNPTDPKLAYQAIRAGALDVCGKLPAESHESFAREQRRFLRLVKALSAVPVVHRFQRARIARRRSTEVIASAMAPAHVTIRNKPQVSAAKTQPDVLLIGASTGGPSVIASLLTQLTAPFPIPILIVQHISEGFGKSFAEWLNSATPHSVGLVDPTSTRLKPGAVYVAQDNQNSVFIGRNQLKCIDADETPFVPCIDMAFSTAARHNGPAAIAVLLTGMGKDGARGLADLKEAGALTIAQQPDTCTVGSMPNEAIALNAACHVLRPEKMNDIITTSLAPFTS